MSVRTDSPVVSKVAYLCRQNPAPVYEENSQTWSCYLPDDNWCDLWSGNTQPAGQITVAAELGKPPVFYRANSEWRDLFAQLRTL